MCGAERPCPLPPCARRLSVVTQQFRGACRIAAWASATWSAAPACSASSVASAKLYMCGPTITGAPRRERLDQVLAAERRERAADDRDVARGVIERHLAHRVAECMRSSGRGQALARCGAIWAQRRHLVEAACDGAAPPRRARAVRTAVAASSIGSSSPSRVLASSTTGRASSLRHARAGSELAPRRAHIELEVAGNFHVARAERTQPRRHRPRSARKPRRARQAPARASARQRR